jgi:hypothetical protein
MNKSLHILLHLLPPPSMNVAVGFILGFSVQAEEARHIRNKEI